MKRFLQFALLLVGAAWVTACGPIDYLNTVTRKATRALADAEAANAEKLAPYEYWSAVTYMQMAREKVAYADFMIAINYGEKAEANALKAKKLASEKGEEGPDARRENQAPVEVIPSSSGPSGTAPADASKPAAASTGSKGTSDNAKEEKP